jgi:hypothetical protein
MRNGEIKDCFNKFERIFNDVVKSWSLRVKAQPAFFPGIPA